MYKNNTLSFYYITHFSQRCIPSLTYGPIGLNTTVLHAPPLSIYKYVATRQTLIAISTSSKVIHSKTSSSCRFLPTPPHTQKAWSISDFSLSKNTCFCCPVLRANKTLVFALVGRLQCTRATRIFYTLQLLMGRAMF
jgi:hypothetical protein